MMAISLATTRIGVPSRLRIDSLRHRPSRVRVPLVPRATAAYAPPDHTLVLSQGATTTQIPLSSAQLMEIKNALAATIKVFADKAAYDAEGSQSPKKWESVDVCVKEEQSGNNVRVEIFCNPNSCMNAFEAKVLVTVRDCTNGMRVMTEVGLEEMKSAYKVVVDDM